MISHGCKKANGFNAGLLDSAEVTFLLKMKPDLNIMYMYISVSVNNEDLEKQCFPSLTLVKKMLVLIVLISVNNMIKRRWY